MYYRIREIKFQGNFVVALLLRLLHGITCIVALTRAPSTLLYPPVPSLECGT